MSTPDDKARAIPAPEPNPETQAFWDGTAAGKLLVRECIACQRVHWYPRALCPHCFSDRTAWREASGQGVIYSWSVMRRVPVPYAIAYVTLAEGPTMLTNIVDCDLDALRVGQPVRLVLKPAANGAQVPMFAPA